MKAKSAMQDNIPHKHLHSRISYLHQAAAYLTQHQLHGDKDWKQHTTARSDTLSLREGLRGKASMKTTNHNAVGTVGSVESLGEVLGICEKHMLLQVPALARHAVSQLRGVSLKGQAHLSSAMKHSVCGRCDAFLIPGSTSSSYIENKSKSGSKPWVDVLVITCNTCRSSRRFPIGARRQCSKLERAKTK